MKMLFKCYNYTSDKLLIVTSFFSGYRRQAATAGRRWHFVQGGFTLEALDFTDMRGWLFDIGLVIVYIHSLNWILAFLLLCFLMYYFFCWDNDECSKVCGTCMSVYFFLKCISTFTKHAYNVKYLRKQRDKGNRKCCSILCITFKMYWWFKQSLILHFVGCAIIHAEVSWCSGHCWCDAIRLYPYSYSDISVVLICWLKDSKQ